MKNVRWLGLVVALLLLSQSLSVSNTHIVSAQGSGCTYVGPEVPDNGVDENCDGWLGTSHGYNLRAAHPRVLLTPERLQATIDRMTGPNAREPYRTWFNLIKAREDQSQDVDLVNLALIYKATNNPTYLTRFLNRRPTTGDPGEDELYAIDIMWDEVPDAAKLNIMQRVSANDNPWYWNSIVQSNADPEDVGWGYHAAFGVERALAYAGAFAYDAILQSAPVVGNPATYNRFNTINYLRVVSKELSDEGYFHRIENRVAGDPTDNDAMPGSPGGMYDNIGYDSSEEAHSVFVLAEYLMLTGQDRYSTMRHDKYRATFYQNMQYPHVYSYAETDRWCRRAGTETHEEARIWFTQTGSWQPYHDAVALTADLYRDPRMQFYFSEARQRVLCGAPYDGMWWDLIFYDDTLSTNPPNTNPTAMYFNGPGLVSLREDWSNDALFAVFVAGEGISRRYEDANSFLLHRKTDIIPHAGARIRFDADNEKHHWYTIRSLSKNTLKVFDPQESFDIGTGGVVGPLHSGQPLVGSDNFGGQLFETPISAYEDCFSSGGCGSNVARYDCSAYPLGVCEVANVIKYEHVPDAYTYSVGDGAAAYTKKIDYFEREFLYLRPDVVVIFDRVQSIDPNFRKVWTVHTVPPPIGSTTPMSTNLGLRQYANERHVTIEAVETTTYLDTLLPQQNKVTLRGGDTLLTQGHALRPGQPITPAHIIASDIPRWLELFAVGGDVLGSVTIEGDAAEGLGVTEVITFDGNVQTYVTSSPTAMSTTAFTDTTQYWIINQWAGYVLRLRGGPSGDVLITGNDQDTLFIAAGYDPYAVWGYYIVRPMANSYLHWQRIERVTTTNLSADNFLISVPHYFDAENSAGQLYSFAPHTDGRDDGYRKSEDLGQWTIEVEAAAPQRLDNFLNVFHLTDPGQPKVATQLVQGAGVSGALIGDWFVLFANTPTATLTASVTLPDRVGVKALILDLQPATDYYYRIDGGTFTISTSNHGGIRIRSTDQGTALIDPLTELALRGAALDEAIRLDWEVATTLPATSTWRIAYISQTAPIAIEDILSPTRAYTLTNLTNYVWYTVTLNAMLDSTPLLTDTITLRPTDRLVYLPIVFRGTSGLSTSIAKAAFPLPSGLSSPDTTYWVSPDGQAAWTSCKGEVPLNGPGACALNIANAQAVAGDTVYLRGGTYPGQVIQPANSGASESNRIVFTNYNGENVLIRDSSYGIYIYKKSYLTVNGVNFYSLRRFFRIYAGHHNTISYCNFDTRSPQSGDWVGALIADDFNDSTPASENSTYNWVHHSTFYRWAYGSYTEHRGGLLDIGSWEQDPIDESSYNLIEDNTFAYGGHHTLGVYSKYNVIRNNYFHNETNPANWAFEGYRDSITEGPVGGYCLYEGNRFGFSGASGLALRTPYNLLRFNLFYGADSGGLQVVSSAAGQDHADYNRIYRNSFYHNGHQETDPGFQGGIYFANWSGQSPQGNVVKSNISYDNKNGSVTYEGQIDPQVIDNNWDQNAIDPGFVDLSASDPNNPNLPDLHLRTNSPGIDAGAFPTRITSAAGSGTQFQVEDARYFTDGWGIPHVQADEIQLASGQRARITNVNYDTNLITVDRVLTWTPNQGIGLAYDGVAPDLGAYEFLPAVVLTGFSGNQSIQLRWTVNVTPPITSTWRIAYYSQTVSTPITINGILSPTRAYTLSPLTNYAWYTVTLNAMLDTTPILTDSIRLMPTDRLVYLPSILK